jgi:hypothetical protein
VAHMRMVGRVAERASREQMGDAAARKEKPYLFTQSLWAAMAYLSKGMVVEGREVSLLSVVGLPAKIAKDVRYGAERGGLAYRVTPYLRGGVGGPLMGYIVQVENDREVLGYYAYRKGAVHG